MRLWTALLAVTLFLNQSISEAQAEKRVALVIANSLYEHATPVPHADDSARAVGAALRRLGFTVVPGFDLDREGMGRTLASFSRRSRDADVALLFYAGHGLQIDGRNYLIPVDARLLRKADVDLEALELDPTLNQIKRADGTNLVLLDACWDNPFGRNLARSMGEERPAATGLAPTNASLGTLIAFAAQPGMISLDGDGRHSPFAAALLAHIETGGIEVTQMLGRTRASVVAMTGGKQIPWVNSSLAVEFYLKPAVTDAPAVDERTVEVAYWESVERSGSEEALQNYLIRYPKGAFVELARAKLEARRIESDRSKVRARRIGELESWIRANRKEFNARLNEFWSPRKSQPGWGRTRVVSHDVVGMKGDYFVLRARLEEISFGNMSTETFLVDLDDGGIRFLGMHRPRS